MSRRARAAFFDVDKTLLPGSCLYPLARAMYRAGWYTARELLGFMVSQVAFRVSGTESGKRMESAREAALAFIAGRRRDELEPLANGLVEAVIGPRVYPGIREVIDAHHAHGDRTFLVTAAPEGVASRLAAYLRMDGALGTRAECVDGVYTGRLLGPVLHGPAKLRAVRELAARERIDLALCSAYSDSVNDRPLLEGVGHPVAVNPDRMLRRLAVERAWPVRDFRSQRRLLLWGPSLVGAVAAGEVTRRALRRRQPGPRARG
ncbi:MAG TPA: HAD-IB family hydrolase [Actinomycetes bacterium]|nr:HAD-IB family hydrolase [Actinomycetes bacterium]